MLEIILHKGRNTTTNKNACNLDDDCHSVVIDDKAWSGLVWSGPAGMLRLTVERIIYASAMQY